MRKELELIQIIEKYLNNELSAEDKTAFEEKLNNNPRLLDEVEKQRLIQEGVKNVVLRTKVKKAWKSYKWGKFGTLGGIIALAVGLTTVATLYLATPDEEEYFSENIKYSQNETGEKVWADADELVKPQFFTINADEDNVLTTEGGMVVAIPKGSLLENGKPVTGTVEIEIKEALNPEDIVLSGLSTKSGDDLLETGGMFYFNARKDGKTLEIDKNNGVVVDVPTNNYKGDMQLYDGVRKEDGTIDWQNPKPIEQFLTTVDVNTLNFYPPNYEKTLAELNHGEKDKRWKDSLYYSFASDISLENGARLQTENIQPIAWRTKVYDNMETKTIVIEAEIEDGWTLYSQYLDNDDGPLPTLITFDIDNEKLIGKTREQGVQKHYDLLWETKVNIFNKKAMFFQEISNDIVEEVNINVNYMMCDGEKCLPPTDVSLSVNLGETEYYDMDSILNGTSLQINPAKIKTIWNEKFNNTLLATKEFEARLQYIFQTCDDEILDLYINNLDKRMATIDSMVVEKLCGKNGKLSKKGPAYRLEGKRLFQANCASCHKLKQNSTGPALAGLKWKWMFAGEKENLYEYIKDPIGFAVSGKSPLAKKAELYSPTVMTAQGHLSREEVDAILDYADYVAGRSYIDKRDSVSISVMDTVAIAEASTEVMPEEVAEPVDLCQKFKEFAAQNKGRVKDGDNAAKILSEYYAKQSKAYAEALAKTQREFWKKYQGVVAEKYQADYEHQEKEIERKADNFQKEYDLNIKEACRQLGIKKNGRISEDQYRVMINNPGWKNVDRAVFESTTNRKTMNYTHTNGKTAVIKYEACEVKVENPEQFDKVLVYLMPRELNSFQRMKDAGKGLFKENLNELIDYQLVAVGMKDDEVYVAKTDEALPQSYQLRLEKTTKKELRKMLRKGNVKSVRNDVIDDVKYELKAIRLNREKAKFEEMEQFRFVIKTSIFPCYDGRDWTMIMEGSMQ